MIDSEMIKQKSNYFDFVNVAKFILAVSIVAMHCALVPDHSWLMTLVCRLGVPYFFAASGFFLQKKCSATDTGASVKRYIKRLLLPYSVFSAVWMIQMLIDDATVHTGASDVIVNILQHLIFFPRGALWYVWASILGVLMLYPFMKRGKLLRALPLGIALFMVGLLANNYYFIADSSSWLKPVVDGYLRIFLVSNNAPFVGFVFLLIGMLINEHYDRIRDIISVRITTVMLLFASALLLCEDIFIAKIDNSTGDGAFYLSQLIYVPVVFYLTTRIPCPHLSKECITTVKNLSTGIYFLHVPMLWIIHKSAEYIFPFLKLSRLTPLFDHASVCFVSCIVLCLVVYRYPKSFICKLLK